MSFKKFLGPDRTLQGWCLKRFFLSSDDTGYPHDGCVDNAAYWQDRRADKRRYPHDREIDIQMSKMFRNMDTF